MQASNKPSLKVSVDQPATFGVETKTNVRYNDQEDSCFYAGATQLWLERDYPWHVTRYHIASTYWKLSAQRSAFHCDVETFRTGRSPFHDWYCKRPCCTAPYISLKNIFKLPKHIFIPGHSWQEAASVLHSSLYSRLSSNFQPKFVSGQFVAVCSCASIVLYF